MLKFFIKYSKGYRHLAILTPIFVALEAFIEVLLPLFMTDIIDLTDPTIGYADSLVSGPMSSLVSYFENLFPNSNNVYIYVYGVVMFIFALLSLTHMAKIEKVLLFRFETLILHLFVDDSYA